MHQEKIKYDCTRKMLIEKTQIEAESKNLNLKSIELKFQSSSKKFYFSINLMCSSVIV
jgi:hypothetical protein